MPGEPLPGAAWVALAPIMLCVSTSDEKESFLHSCAAGFVYFSSVHLWGNAFGWEVWLSISLLMTLYMGLWGVATCALLKRQPDDSPLRFLIPPLCWTVFETLRSLGILGVNWGSIAYSAYQNPAMLKAASIAGMSLVTMILASSSSLAAEAARQAIEGRRHGRSLAVSAAALAALAAFPAIVPSAEEGRETIRIGVIQPGFDMITKKDPLRAAFILREQERLTMECAASRPDLIIWPETSLPGLYPRIPEKAFMSRLAKRAGAPILYGILSADSEGKKNSAVLYGSDGKFRGIYSKRRLVPFGEYNPLPESLRDAHPMMRLIPGLSPGKGAGILDAGGRKFGVIICFESDFPQYARESAKGADFIAVITNDGWFENYSAAEHHAAWNAMRAAENGIPIVQAANSGISMVVSPKGKITRRMELFSKGYFTEDVRIGGGRAPCAVLGDSFTILCHVALLAIAAATFAKGKEKAKRGKNEDNNPSDAARHGDGNYNTVSGVGRRSGKRAGTKGGGNRGGS